MKTKPMKPSKPDARGTCHACNNALGKPTALFCNKACRYTFYGFTKEPSLATMERWSNDGVAKATDGCRVEPDGECEHGHESWIRALGLI